MDMTVGGTPKTATEVVSENSELYRTLSKHEIIVEDAIKELIAIIIHYAQATLGVQGLNADAEVTIDFDDSIIEDKTQEFSRDMLLYNAGAMTVEELRAKYMGESLEEATKALAGQEEPEDLEDDEE
jgi:A118 family predicted phage portal protein